MDKPRDETAIRVQAQQATLFALLKSGVPTAGKETAWKSLSEATAKTLGVQRVSIWLLSTDHERLVLEDLYDLAAGRHTKGAVLEAKRYPAYFHALRWSRAIVAPNAATDARTLEFSPDYLEPLKIASMLDAGIWQAGEARGVVCLEAVGEPRNWTTDEQQFAGSIADLAASVLDHEALREARSRLEISEELFSRALQSSPDWISVVRIDDGMILHVNEAFERESGHLAKDVVGKTTLGVGIWADPAQRARWTERVRSEGLVRGFEADFRTKSGEQRIFQLSGHRVVIHGADCVVTISRDVTVGSQHLRELEHQARHDPLTGLTNRMYLRERLDEGLRGLAERGERGALLLVDLDRFKEVNDTLGHHVGDALLIKLSRRLEQEMRSFCGGEVSRLGGDEFAVWIEGLPRAGAEEAAAARALTAITAPLEIEGYRLEVGASIGIALAPAHGNSAAQLLRCADVAMYGAKRHGSGFAVYDAKQDPYSEERLALLSELGASVRNGQMEVFYQPRVSLADRRLSGFEALARWRHPRLGLLPPARFIPLAELSDVIRPLTLWVLETALAQHRSWGGAGRMAVNLSARHLLDDSCPEQVARILAEAGADPGSLELEITESALIADPERARHTLERIRSLGVRIAIDDFGTGYSSLSHLKRLPLHALKIDVSFVRQMLASPADGVIVDITIALAHQLGLTVSAEGIEDEATMEALRAHGCDEGQGFLIAHPMSATDAAHWLQTLGDRPLGRPH